MKKKNYIKYSIMIFASILIISLFIFIYAFDSIVMPTVMIVADSEMRAKATEILNTNILKEYSKNFNYDEIIRVEKDNEGNITMLKADTLKLNTIANEVSLNSQKDIKNLGNVGIKIPMGYVFKNNILANIGPSITVKMQPIGNVEIKYSSAFETAGINQTRHKIYVDVNTRIRTIIPLKSSYLEVKTEIPISETIIVGKVPRTAIDLDLDGVPKEVQ